MAISGGGGRITVKINDESNGSYTTITSAQIHAVECSTTIANDIFDNLEKILESYLSQSHKLGSPTAQASYKKGLDLMKTSTAEYRKSVMRQLNEIKNEVKGKDPEAALKKAMIELSKSVGLDVPDGE